MTNKVTNKPDNQAEEFQAAAQDKRTGLVREFWDFLKHNKKWWLTPIIIFMLGMGLVMILGSTGAAPFIYALF